MFFPQCLSNVYLMEVCMHWNKICMSLPGPLAKLINCRYQKYIFKRLKRTGVRNCTWRIPPSCHPRDIHSMPLFHSIVIFCHKSYNIVNEHINKNLKSFFENLSTSTVPVIGIPEKPCLAFASTTSPTVWQGPRTKGSLMKPCSNFFTRFTSLTWNSTEQLWCSMPIPPLSCLKSEIVWDSPEIWTSKTVKEKGN